MLTPSITAQLSASPTPTWGSSGLPGGSLPVIFVQPNVMTLRAAHAAATAATAAIALVRAVSLLSDMPAPPFHCLPRGRFAGFGRRVLGAGTPLTRRWARRLRRDPNPA